MFLTPESATHQMRLRSDSTVFVALIGLAISGWLSGCIEQPSSQPIATVATPTATAQTNVGDSNDIYSSQIAEATSAETTESKVNTTDELTGPLPNGVAASIDELLLFFPQKVIPNQRPPLPEGIE